MRKPIACALAVGVFAGIGARADDSVSPYIDHLRQEIQKRDAEQGKKPPSDESYTESIKKKLAPAPEEKGTEPYIDQLKREHPEEFGQKNEGSYIEEKKAEIGSGDQESAIEKLKQGKSQLTMKRPGKITGAFGFDLGLGVSHNITANNQPGNPPSFSQIYGGHFVPDVNFFGEHQFFHSETYGSVGVVASLGINYYWGYGQYQIQLYQPSGSTFPMMALTKFSFGAIPVAVGADYRFNLGNIVRPFVMLKPTVIPYFETRDDGGSGHHGFSKGLYSNAGINILLDGISKDVTWDLYTDFDVKHSYFTVQFTKLTTFASDVSFNYYGANVGFTFEF